MGRSWEDRVAEYENSNRLTQRLKVGPRVSSTVLGNGGLYVTSAHLEDEDKSECSCPFEGFPCKHIVAVERTYRAHPKTFRDVDVVLRRFRKKSPKELLTQMRRMILAAPTCLTALGVRGFEPPENEDHDW